MSPFFYCCDAVCLQTHPDVAGTQSSNNAADKFKRISEAYSILSNHKERIRYDFEMSDVGIMELRKKAAEAARARANAGGGGAGTFGAALPRNLLIGGMIGFTGVTLLRMMWPTKDEDDDHGIRTNIGHKKLVEAWKNPDTGRWEKPRPWDPMYQRLQPTLQFIPRDEVHDGKR